MNPREKSKVKIFFYAILPILCGIFLASFIFKYVELKKTVDLNSNSSEQIINTNVLNKEEKQKYFYFNKGQDKVPKLSAEAYIVGDLNTGEIIMLKNEDKVYPIASVSKLMTAITAQDIATEDDIAPVTSRALATYGGNGGFYKGEKIKVKELFYPLLLESSNDAAEVIAEYFDRDLFIQKMNEEAERLKMTKTSFEDPSGLSANNTSTVEDLFKMAGYLYRQGEKLLEITKQKSYTTKKHVWFSNNQFLHKKEYLGGKSGYTDPARQTVISIFNLPLGENITRPIGIALLRSADRAKDVNTILQYLNKYIYYGGAKDAEADWIKEKLEIPDVFDPTFVTLTFGGDIMLDRGVRNSVMKNFGGDYSKLFDNLELLKDRDIVFANLEGPASNQGTDLNNLYSFRMDPSVIPALKGAGISIVSVANNHVGDWGREAYADTLARLKENEILYTGGGQNKTEAEEPAVIEKYGIKIGFIGFSDVGPTNMKVSTENAGLLLANDPRFEEIIKNASQKVDYLIVSFHFGEEYQFTHNQRQEELAHKAIDNGAKIVVGHHPHVTQDTEVYKNGYIIYSLGNFIFDQGFRPETMQGSVVDIKLKKDGSISVAKNIVKLNHLFQPDQFIKRKEERIKFEEIKKPE